MQNSFLAERTVRDIDKRVSKILKDLGYPEPPLRLEIVRELLRLDLAYYSTSDQGVLAETVHRLTVAGKQVMQRPGLLLDAVKKLDLKALWIPDRKRILIDKELPAKKQRWGEAHEITHGILPWHEAAMHGDRKQTLSPTCEQQIEAEANFGAGRLLFLQDRFTDQLRGSPLTIDRVKALGGVFGNSITSTLWRAVEASAAPMFGLVSQHPKRPLGEEPIRYFIRSRSFLDRFDGVTPTQVFRVLQSFCRGSRGPLGTDEVIFFDSNGDPHVFLVECFYNSYEALTLGVHLHPRTLAPVFFGAARSTLPQPR